MSSDNGNNTVVISCRVDKETDATIGAMADEMNYPKSTVAGLILRFGSRWFKSQVSGGDLNEMLEADD